MTKSRIERILIRKINFRYCVNKDFFPFHFSFIYFCLGLLKCNSRRIKELYYVCQRFTFFKCSTNKDRNVLKKIFITESEKKVKGQRRRMKAKRFIELYNDS